ncbi:MAG: hypothetical protein Q8K32_32535 [Archangium sp.]|nr:hypothetical protein [Archangium sp.]
MKAWAIAAFLVLPALLLFPVLSGERQFFYRDVTRQYQPLQAQLDRAWADQSLPLWNASTQGGVPLLANVHAGALAPWFPVFRMLPFHLAYGLLVTLAWAALMAGAFVFLRGRLPVMASVLGALSFGFTGVVFGATSYLPFLAGLACIPWQLVALRRADRLTGVSWLAVLFTLQVLTGDPSTALMGGLVCVVAALLEGRGRGVSSALAAGLLALGLSAVQLLPAWTLYEESARSASSLDSRLAWSFHPARTLEWLVRLPYGELLEPPYFTRWDLAAGPDAQPFLLEHGWGLLALLMLGAGLFTRGPLRRLGVALVALGFFLSLGRHLGPLQQLFTLPPLSVFRFPERYGALVALGSALLSAHGAGVLLDAFTLRRRWAAGWLVMGALLAGAALMGAAEPVRQAMLSTASLLAVAGLLGLLLARVRWAWLLSVLAMGAVEAAHAVPASVLTLPAETLETRALAPGHRLWRENAALRKLERPVRGADDFARERRLLHATWASATPGLHGVDELGGFSPVALRRWQRVIQATAGRPVLLSQLFDVCSFVSTRERGQRQPDWAPVAQLADETFLYETKACLGRAWAVSSVVEVADTEAAVQHLVSGGFTPSTMATREDSGEPLPPLAPTTVESIVRKGAGQLELVVSPSAQWALVVVSETWAPGWRVWVDGVERPVELLDGTLLGVAVPPGGRALRFDYGEPLLTSGAALSSSAVLLLALLWLRRRGVRT